MPKRACFPEDFVDDGDRKRPEMPHGDVLMAMIGLLCLGKSNYADIEPYRHEDFFRRALGLKQLPSEETLRQPDRIDICDSAIANETDQGMRFTDCLLDNGLQADAIGFEEVEASQRHTSVGRSPPRNRIR